MTTRAAGQRDCFDQAEFDQFRQFLQDACGIALGDNKQYLVSSRMRRLLEEHKLASFSALLVALNRPNSRRLKDQVIDAMTTNETFWFRDIYPFEHLKDQLLPALMVGQQKSTEPIRIWSAACSSGQEPYSISIAVEEYRQNRTMGVLRRPVQIVATDLSSIVLEQARAGSYDRAAIARGLSEERLTRYFDKRDDRWHVKPVIRERVQFKALNLLDPYMSLGRFDVVFCRNVLIYFDAELKQRILRKLHGVLKPGGILCLGSSESLAGAGNLFEMVRCEPGIMYRAI